MLLSPRAQHLLHEAQTSTCSASRDFRVHSSGGGRGGCREAAAAPRGPSPTSTAAHLPVLPQGDFHAPPPPAAPSAGTCSSVRVCAGPSRLLTRRPFLPPFHLHLRSPPPRHKSEESSSPDTRKAFCGAQELTLKISLNFPGHHKPLLPIGLVIFLGGKPIYFTGLMAL